MAQDIQSNSEKFLLDIRDLHVQYHTDDAVVCALNGFNLQVRRGEKLGLVGETGAGKTTMALSVLRLLPEKIGKITAGSILYGEDDLVEQTEAFMLGLRGRRISMIFQDAMTSLNPIVSVGDQIMEVLDLHAPGMSRHEKSERVDRILTMVGIPPARKAEFPYQFSGGMKQRIVIAMALIAEPELLLADEPTTALDVTIQAQILDMMGRLKEQFNTAVVLITHDLGVVAEFCDRVAVVYAGKVVEEGTVEQVFGRARNHPYTVGLLNCIPDLESTAARLIPIPGQMVDPTRLPPGCAFADRCAHCMDVCRREPPEMNERDGHRILCHLFKEREG
ncbi:MAG TPA: ABC transporter ATP-binding protein [Candidatus Pullichristensenella excrementigallinarum]|uniref:ABC transporter ATP-binding protein n=1 Tax=Candidatus Pullichristensenella excrementigallinarum TaxID=2840907 RepID=A0A9D1ICF9_9FIRM|nr:ABC transporter ATP-binding protein [Candidatus Pullichristensenella excrementigallinarum]